MTKWPPILWLGVAAGSLFVLRGSAGGIRPPWLIAGAAMLGITFIVSAYLALRPGQGPMRPLLKWSVGGLFALYIAFAAGAALAGGKYAVAALLAGVVPLTAMNLWVATVRSKTSETDDGAVHERSVDEDESPYPGIGLDDDTPLGDTPEHSGAHDDEDVLADDAGPRPTPRFRRLRRTGSFDT